MSAKVQLESKADPVREGKTKTEETEVQIKLTQDVEVAPPPQSRNEDLDGIVPPKEQPPIETEKEATKETKTEKRKYTRRAAVQKKTLPQVGPTDEGLPDLVGLVHDINNRLREVQLEQLKVLTRLQDLPTRDPPQETINRVIPAAPRPMAQEPEMLEYQRAQHIRDSQLAPKMPSYYDMPPPVQEPSRKRYKPTIQDNYGAIPYLGKFVAWE